MILGKIETEDILPTLATLWHSDLSKNCPPAKVFPPELIFGESFWSFPPGKDHPGPEMKGSAPGKRKIREILSF